MKKSSKSRGAGGGGKGGKYTSIRSQPDPIMKSNSEEDFSARDSGASSYSPAYLSESGSIAAANHSIASDSASPFSMSPWNNAAPAPSSSPWSTSSDPSAALFPPGAGLVGSLVREEGHVYSLAASADLLYTGSDSKNIRVWKRQKEFSGFKSSSGLVKAIVVSPDLRVFSGHQDGKVRIWRPSPKKPRSHKRVGTLPRLKDFLKCSMNPSNYVESRRHKSGVWIRHSDAVSTLALSDDLAFLYSGSWDRTLKVWRLADSKCVESINAHGDAVNAVVAVGATVFTGSADGTVKVWRREEGAKGATRHVEVRALLRQDSAVTALAVNRLTEVVYSGSSDGAVNLWELKGLAHGGVLHGHKLAVLCLASAGNLLFSGSADKTICVWGREAGGAHVCMSVLTGHGGPVKCLAVAEDPDGGDVGPGKVWVLYSGSLDKSVKVWKVCDEACQPDPGSADSSAGPPKFDMY